jgi:hypothetical protein
VRGREAYTGKIVDGRTVDQFQGVRTRNGVVVENVIRYDPVEIAAS